MILWAALLASTLILQGPGEVEIRVDAARVIHRVSPLLHGACLEDVNHEVYGGLYSQMIFGESFQEPPRPTPLKGFTAHGGEWSPRDGGLDVAPGPGSKLVADLPPLVDAEVAVEVRFPSDQEGNAGLIVRVDRPGTGADAFTGYEVSLETAGFVVLGRHRRNWEPLRRLPCPVPTGRWIALVARMRGPSIEVLVDGRSMLTFEDTEHPLPAGLVGLRTWQRPASFRNLRINSGGPTVAPGFEPVDPASADRRVSGMWGPVTTGQARGRWEIETASPFVGVQTQRITSFGGEGMVGVENQGLNRRGLGVVAGRPYDGYVWAKSEQPATLRLAIESRDGLQSFGSTTVEVAGPQWMRYDFAITPDRADPLNRFAITLDRPGSVVLGHAFLQPGEWGRFHGLPVRKDVAEGLVDQGIKLLRYGGTMINHPLYRWKEMVGPRDRRPTHAGHWYAHATSGWGIFDFLAFCEAAGFVGIPAVNMDETPADMADFIEYVNGPADSPWGRKRAADGHPAPYGLKHLELGNEEAINDEYVRKFTAIARAIWAKDPAMILVVGDFAYNKVIDNPDRFEGGAAATSLAGHRKILELARANGREVWFDIHVWTDHPPEPAGLKPERSYLDQLGKLAPGARFKVVIFEYNSGNHRMKRALSNALAAVEVESIGDLLPVACAANCLQPDGQNDNGWDQGLLFLDPSKVWLQPPGHFAKMANRLYQPWLVRTECRDPSETLRVNAKRSDDGKTLVLMVVNPGDAPRPARVGVAGFAPTRRSAEVETLSGPLESANTAAEPDRVAPRRSTWDHQLPAGPASYTFPARSITMIRLD
jgi:hypothetical protein